MSYPHPHHLKRLQHDVNTNLHLSSHNHQSNNYRPQLPHGDAAIRESLQQFTISTNPQFSRPVYIFLLFNLFYRYYPLLFSLIQVLSVLFVVVVVDDRVVTIGIHH